MLPTEKEAHFLDLNMLLTVKFDDDGYMMNRGWLTGSSLTMWIISNYIFKYVSHTYFTYLAVKWIQFVAEFEQNVETETLLSSANSL